MEYKSVKISKDLYNNILNITISKDFKENLNYILGVGLAFARYRGEAFYNKNINYSETVSIKIPFYTIKEIKEVKKNKMQKIPLNEYINILIFVALEYLTK